MIRFIDIRESDTGYRFSFWNTISDRYVELNGEQAWELWEEFVEDLNGPDDRYAKLCPDWVFTYSKSEV